MSENSDDDRMFYTTDALDHGLLHLRFGFHGDAVDVNVLGARVEYVAGQAHSNSQHKSLSLSHKHKYTNTHTQVHTHDIHKASIPVIQLVNMGTTKSLMISDDELRLGEDVSYTDRSNQSYSIGSNVSSIQSLNVKHRTSRRGSQVSTGSAASAGEAVYMDLNTHTHIYTNNPRNQAVGDLPAADKRGSTGSDKQQAEDCVKDAPAAICPVDASTYERSDPNTKGSITYTEEAQNASDHTQLHSQTRDHMKPHLPEYATQTNGTDDARCLGKHTQPQQECSFWVSVFLDRNAGEQPVRTGQTVCRPVAVPVIPADIPGQFHGKKRRASIASGSSNGRGLEGSYSSILRRRASVASVASSSKGSGIEDLYSDMLKRRGSLASGGSNRKGEEDLYSGLLRRRASIVSSASAQVGEEDIYNKMRKLTGTNGDTGSTGGVGNLPGGIMKRRASIASGTIDKSNTKGEENLYSNMLKRRASIASGTPRSGGIEEMSVGDPKRSGSVVSTASNSPGVEDLYGSMLKRRASIASGTSSRGDVDSCTGLLKRRGSVASGTSSSRGIDEINSSHMGTPVAAFGVSTLQHKNSNGSNGSSTSITSSTHATSHVHRSHEDPAHNDLSKHEQALNRPITPTRNFSLSQDSPHPHRQERGGRNHEALINRGHSSVRSRSRSCNPPAPNYGLGGNVSEEVRYEYRPTWHSVIRLNFSDDKSSHMLSNVDISAQTPPAETHGVVGESVRGLRSETEQPQSGGDCSRTGECKNAHKHKHTYTRADSSERSHKHKAKRSSSLARASLPQNLSHAQLMHTLTAPKDVQKRSQTTETKQDALDLLWLHGIKVVAVLMRNSRPVGQVAIPVKNVTAGDAWFSLDPVSAKNLHIAKRGKRKHNRTSKATRLFAKDGVNHGHVLSDYGEMSQSGSFGGGNAWDESQAGDTMLCVGGHTGRLRRWCCSVMCCGVFNRWRAKRKHKSKDRSHKRWRKLASLRTLWLTSTFMALFSVLLVTTLLMYKYALQELELGASVVSEQLWMNIDTKLLTEFAFPEQTTVSSSSYFLLPQLRLDDTNVITSFMVGVEREVLSLPTVNVSAIFVGSPSNTFYGAGLTEHNDTIKRQVLVKNSTNAGITGYAVDTECELLEEASGCAIYNTDEVLLFIPALNITQRPWYMNVERALGLAWTPVYPYAAGNLGITCSYRVPQDLDTEVKAVVAADVLLDDLSAVLASFKYFETGYSVLFEMNNGLLAASSLTTPGSEGFNVTETRTCENTNDGENEPATVLDRKRLYLSEDERLISLSDFLIDLCNTECICYLQIIEEPPVTAQCPEPLTFGDTNCSAYPAKDTYACQPVPLLNPKCANSTPSFSKGVPQQYTLPNQDILSIGLLQLVNGGFVSAVIVPRDDFTDNYGKVLQWSVLVAVCILLLSMVIALVIVNLVTREFTLCTKQLARFAALDFSRPVTQNSGAGVHNPIKEIAMVYEVMQSLRQSLRSFSKYVPPDVVRILIHSGLEATLGGQRKKVITVFFSDIVDFTSISESLEIEVLNRVLGDYLQEMSSIITQNGGTVDKYIGDAIMALWNAPEIVVDHAGRCCEAALLCQAALQALRQRWESEQRDAKEIEIANACTCTAITLQVCSGEATCTCAGSMCAQVSTDRSNTSDSSGVFEITSSDSCSASAAVNRLGRFLSKGAASRTKPIELKGIDGMEGEIYAEEGSDTTTEISTDSREIGGGRLNTGLQPFNYANRDKGAIEAKEKVLDGEQTHDMICHCGKKSTTNNTSRRRKSRRLPQLYQRIGIHTGPAVVGNFGSEDRLQYTAIGNTVNMCEYLEGLNKKYGTEILISSETYALVCSKFVCRPIDDVYYTDTSGLVRVYELIAHQDTATSEQISKADLYTSAFEAMFDDADLERAVELFTQYCDTYCPPQSDGKTFDGGADVAVRHLEACKILIATPEPWIIGV